MDYYDNKEDKIEEMIEYLSEYYNPGKLRQMSYEELKQLYDEYVENEKEYQKEYEEEEEKEEEKEEKEE